LAAQPLASVRPHSPFPSTPNLGRQVLGLAEWLSEHAESSWDTHLSVERTANNLLNFVNPSNLLLITKDLNDAGCGIGAKPGIL